MQDKFKNYEEEQINKKKRRRAVKAVTAIGALAVAAVVMWQLMLPGIAMQNTPHCGKEEHTHTDACYTNQLTCGQEETDGHQHTDACYKTERVLSCGQEESETHHHTDACYTEQKVLVCGQQEKAAHHHTSACYTKKLTCGKEEHTHTDACYSDPTADVENEDTWKRTFAGVQLGDDWGDNVAAIAKTQVGYHESEKNYNVVENNEHKGYTRYGNWAGGANIYGNWDTTFVEFCIHYAQIPDTAFPMNLDIDQWIKALQDNNLYVDKTSEDYQAGDLIFFQKKNQETEKQVGIIEKVEEKNNKTYITVIEGNCENQVKKNEYTADDENILGYGLICKAQMKYKAAQMLQEDANTSEDTTAAEADTQQEVQVQNAENTETNQTVFYSDDANVNTAVTQNEIDERINLNIGSNIPEGKNGQTLKVNIHSTYSSANQQGNGEIRIDISKLPDGVTLAGFTNDKMNVAWNNGTTMENIEVTLHHNEDGSSYITFNQPEGSTVNFELLFNSQNGIMDAANTVKVTPSIVNKTDKDQINVNGTSISEKPDLTLTWTGKNSWDGLDKKVNSSTIDVDSEKNQLKGKLDYTIKVQEHNGDGQDDTGAIWTKEVEFKDTLTLPEGMSFPEGAYVDENSKKVVDKDGNTIFEFKNLDKNQITNITLGDDGKSIVYDITVKNPNMKDGVPTKEMDSINLNCTLDAEKLKLDNNYTSKDKEEIKKEIIKNNVQVKTYPYKGKDSYEDEKEVTTTPSTDEKFELTKKANKEGQQVNPGEEIEYTVSLKNTGSVPLPAVDENGNKRLITDTLPEYVVLTEEQKKVITDELHGTYNETTRTITWEAGEIKPGEEKKITFKVNIADAEALKDKGDWYEIKNNVKYQDKTAESTVKYKKPSIELTKTANKKSVKDGDIITYKVVISNPEAFESVEEIISDTLENGLEFIGMVDKDGKELTNSGTFKAEANINGNMSVHDVILNKINDNGKIKLEWTIGKLQAKETVTLYYQCRVNAEKLGNATVIKNNVSSNTGEWGNADVSVTPSLSVDKKVKTDGEEYNNGGGTYADGTVFDYKVSVKNAKDAKVQNNVELVDKLQAGLIPYNYTLYTLKSGKEWQPNLKIEDLEPSQVTFEQFLDKNYGWGPYYTVINNDVVKVTKVGEGRENDKLYAAVLTWYIAEIQPDQTVTKTYQAKLSMSENEKEQGKKSYKNTATVGGSSSEVTIDGSYSSGEKGKVDIRKDVYGIVELDNTSNGNLQESLSNKKYFSLQKKNATNGKYVIYNITVVNTGKEKVNINKIVDEMSDGLEYVGIAENTWSWDKYRFDKKSITTTTGHVAGRIHCNKEMVSATISEVDNGNKNNSSVEFKVGDEKDNNKDLVLPKNKGFSFFVMCKVKDNVAENTLLTNNAKLYVDKDTEYNPYGIIKTNNTENDIYQNNGDSQDDGLTSDGKNRVISSSVTVIPMNNIVPGITKKAIGYVDPGKTINSYNEITEENKKTSISPQSTVKWQIELLNDGTIPMDAYTITDSVQAPFHILTREEAEDTSENGLHITSEEIRMDHDVFTLQIYDAKNKQVGGKHDLSSKVWDALQNRKTDTVSINISESENLSIPAGGKAVFMVYTKNDDANYTIYNNTATLTPKDSFNATRVTTGEVVNDNSGKATGVKATDSVYALGEYGSFSWKTIEEKDNSENNGVGYDTSKNYITLENNSQNKTVVYTNNIENVSTLDYRKMVITDLMPYPNDVGVLNKDSRGSKFTVNLSNMIQLFVKNGNDSTPLVAGKDYTVKYSTKTSFTENEMKGQLNSEDWHDSLQNGDKAFCIVMNDSFRLEPGRILQVQYEGIVGEDAKPGDIAWNSFGYAYDAGNGYTTRLKAEPPKVGLKIQNEPTIEKEVVDRSGNTVPYDTSKKFTFAIYEGNTTTGTPLKTFEICQGGSIKLKDLKNNDVPILQNGQQYTIVETNTNGYTFVGVGKKGETLSANNSYTFTYSTDQDFTILFRNRYESYELPSTGGTGTTGYLAGGAALMCLAALLYGYQLRRKRERGTK